MVADEPPPLWAHRMKTVGGGGDRKEGKELEPHQVLLGQARSQKSSCGHSMALAVSMHMLGGCELCGDTLPGFCPALLSHTSGHMLAWAHITL